MNHQKYESAVEKATVEAFKIEFERLHYQICFLNGLARIEGEGLWDGRIQDFLDRKISKDEPLGFGLQMALDGIESKVIEQCLDSWIGANCSGHCEYYNRILFSVAKAGVLSIKEGTNPTITDIFLKSLIPVELMPDWTEYYPEAVKEFGWLLEFIPEEFRTKELCCDAIKDCGLMLRYVPVKFRTKELCIEAVAQAGYSLGFVPEKFKTQKLCLHAVKRNGKALEFVPEKFKTKELCTEAVKREGDALEFVPEKFKTKELCTEAIKHIGYALKYVPKEFKTAEFCLAAVKKSEFAIHFVPKQLRTVELYTEMVKQRCKREHFEYADMETILEDVPVYFRNDVWEAVHKSELEIIT